MPTFKHPCPHCGKYVARDVAACPFCGTPDPFAPARCPSCRAVIEDRAWLSCPKCGQALARPPAASQAGSQASAPSSAGPRSPEPAAPNQQAAKCTGCGAPLPTNARFCTVCGTLAG